MLDIKLIRENPEVVKKDLEKRQDKEKLEWLDDLISKDNEWRDLKKEVDELRHKRNEATQEISKLKKEGKDAAKKVKEAKELGQKLVESEKGLEEISEKIDFYLKRLPNILHESVPVGEDDTENEEVKVWGEKPEFDFELKSHGDLLQSLGLADFVRSAKVSGNGFYYLIGDLALLNQALMRFAIDRLVKKGYTLVDPPLMLRRKPYEGVTDLADFETMMYKIEDEDLYLIATSEHPIGAMYMDELIDEDNLPLKFAGVSPCFRKEIGSKGVDTKGLFRLHQFNKIEQFVFCKPEDSWKIHEEILANAEKMFQELGLHYRVVNICTGDIGIVAAKKYDIEAWSPRQNKFMEVVSCSNCTDYQARRLNIKYGKEGGEKKVLHTLNSTAIATTRAIVAIVENYQQKDGTILVPKVLQPYLGKKVLGK